MMKLHYILYIHITTVKIKSDEKLFRSGETDWKVLFFKRVP